LRALPTELARHPQDLLDAAVLVFTNSHLKVLWYVRKADGKERLTIDFGGLDSCNPHPGPQIISCVQYAIYN